jgi:hypothetical protein
VICLLRKKVNDVPLILNREAENVLKRKGFWRLGQDIGHPQSWMINKWRMKQGGIVCQRVLRFGRFFELPIADSHAGSIGERVNKPALDLIRFYCTY